MYSLHPALVHFPIGLFAAALVFEGIGLLSGRPDFSRFSWWAQIAGAIGLAAAVVTGLIAASHASASGAVQNALDSHRQFAFLAASSLAGMAIWRASKRGKIPAHSTRIYVALLAVCVFLLLITAWFGGELVFLYGLGIRTP